MKVLYTSFLFLLIAQVLNSQIKIDVSTDKQVYKYGDKVQISVTVTNTSEDTVYLGWGSACQSNYYFDEYNWFMNASCATILTGLTLQPGQSHTWLFNHPNSSIPEPVLSIGLHKIVGEVLDYGKSDTLEIAVIDTINSNEELLSVKIVEDTVQIWNTEVFENCASKFTSSITFLDSSNIVITECDTVGPIADCICYFDLFSSLTGLTSGQYTVLVYRQELEKYFYPRDTTQFIGELTFTLENSLHPDTSVQLTQSNCYYPTEETFTALYWIDEAITACRAIRNGAKLMRIFSGDVSVEGKAARWNYEFAWYNSETGWPEYLYFHNNQDQVLLDSISLEMELGSTYITEEWFDSDSALAFAEASGGKTFREENPDYIIRVSVSEALVPYSYPVWYIAYSSLTDLNKKFSVHFDAIKNYLAKISFYPEVDTLYLFSGCTIPELSFSLGSISAANVILLETGLNTTVMLKDSLGSYIPNARRYFYVIPYEENYEYELWYHPKSYPPFDPILIPFDSVFSSEQSYFEIKLIVKLESISIDSLSQLFKADFGLDVGPDNNMVKEFALFQNYPNPFNPNTNFEFQIAKSGFVSLKVFDVLGKEVVTLINEERPAGIYKVEFNGGQLSSGIYFYVLNAEGKALNKKMCLLK